MLKRLKPGASVSTHLLLASTLWTVVGIGLLFRGVGWLLAVDNIALILLACGLGTLKSLFILDKSARKSINRIKSLADGSCLGGVYSIKTWTLVVCMIFLGYFLRHQSVSHEILGVIYVGIGWALLLSSRIGWTAWLNKSK
jgi:lysylphosphatidylglycerol synthetase-like protein (DUF2156 family)